MSKLRKYFKGVGVEAKRVRWPKKNDLWTSIGVVIFVTVFCSLCLACADGIAAKLLGLLEEAFKSWGA